MKAFLLDGETLDCLAKSSHLSRLFSAAEFGPGAGGFATGVADGLAGAAVARAGTAGVAGRAAFFSGFAAASGFVLALAERQALTNALRLSPCSPFFAAAALQGHGLWWTAGSPGVEPTMLTCAGMPRAQGFAAMLDGTWH